MIIFIVKTHTSFAQPVGIKARRPGNTEKWYGIVKFLVYSFSTVSSLATITEAILMLHTLSHITLGVYQLPDHCCRLVSCPDVHALPAKDRLVF